MIPGIALNLLRRRLIHTASTLPFKDSSGVGTFLSSNAVDMLKSSQQASLGLLNRYVRGTALEKLSIYQLMEKMHQDVNNASLYSTASQAWNLDFFLQGLSPTPTSPPEKVVEMIEKSFGSMETFKEQFALHAEGLVGSGWVWLVRKEGGELKIACTFNTGSPLFDSVVPATFSNQTKTAYNQPALPVQQYRKPTNTSSTGLFASFSFAKPTSPNAAPSLISNTINLERKEEPSCPEKLPENAETLPLIGLSVWEHAYLLDYGLDRSKYVGRFWDAVNWNRVAIMLGVY